jgi:hypothetical protein
MTLHLNVSVPAYTRKPPRELADGERRAFHRVVDALIPPTRDLPSPSRLANYDAWLDRALAARNDSFEAAVASAVLLSATHEADLVTALKQFSEVHTDAFHLLSSVVAGAYLMVPEVRAAIGYPGQRRHHPQFDEAANQIMDGILDPVIERGPVYTPAP